MTPVRLEAGADDAGRRLDRVLRKALPDCSLSLIHRLLRQGKIRLDGKPAGPETKVWAGAAIEISIREGSQKRQPLEAPLKIPALSALPGILAMGSGIVVFNKPAGLASHGPESLDTMVKAHYAEKLPPSLSFKPGPLHRLDRPTSGIIAFSENLAGARLFTELLREQRIAKTYLAIVEGRMPGGAESAAGELLWRDGLIRDKTAKKTVVGTGEAASPTGKFAETSVRVIACDGFHTFIEVNISTGRTHQIRSQAAAHGHPLAGDVKYGGRAIPGGGIFLHAWKLGFDIDIAGLPRVISAPLPEAFMARITGTFDPDTCRQGLPDIFS